MLKTYIINLDRDTEQLAKIAKNLENTDLDIVRVSATLGRDASMVEQKKYLVRSTFQEYLLPFATSFQKGCAMSHLRVYEEFLKGDDEYILILEDDARLLYKYQNTGLSNKIRQIVSQYPNDWDFIRLISQGFCGINYPHVKPLCGSNAAYIISRKGAERILKNGGVGHIDLIISSLNNFNLYNHKEKLFEQPNAYGTSDNATSIDKKLLTLNIGDGDLPLWFYVNNDAFKNPMTNEPVIIKQVIIFILFIICIIAVYNINKNRKDNKMNGDVTNSKFLIT